jgi:hypothetical protein
MPPARKPWTPTHTYFQVWETWPQALCRRRFLDLPVWCGCCIGKQQEEAQSELLNNQ